MESENNDLVDDNTTGLINGNLAEDSIGSSLEEAQQTGIIIHGEVAGNFHADEYDDDDFEEEDESKGTTSIDNQAAIIELPSTEPEFV